MTTIEPTRTPGWETIVPVWVLSAIGAVVIGLASPASEYFTWIPVALAAAVVTTFVIQLATLTTVGFVYRAMISISGAVLIFAAATGVLALVVALNG